MSNANALMNTRTLRTSRAVFNPKKTKKSSSSKVRIPIAVQTPNKPSSSSASSTARVQKKITESYPFEKEYTDCKYSSYRRSFVLRGVFFASSSIDARRSTTTKMKARLETRFFYLSKIRFFSRTRIWERVCGREIFFARALADAACLTSFER